MAVDYSALLYDPIYAELGVPATFSAGTGGEVAITVIDGTKAKSEAVSSARMMGDAVETRGIGPVAFARIPELIGKGIASADWKGAILVFSGRSWVVRYGDPLGSPNGEDYGEVRFQLRRVEEPTSSA